MSNDINLLPRKPSTLSRSFSKRNKLIRAIAIALLFIVPTFTVILFLFIYFSPLPSLQQQESSLLVNASTFQQKTASVAFINDRVAKSTQFIALRSAYKDAFQEIIGQLPPDVTVNSLSMQSNTLTLSVISTSLSSLKTYQDSLTNLKSGQVLQKIKFQTITLQQDGTGYQMTLGANIHE